MRKLSLLVIAIAFISSCSPFSKNTVGEFFDPILKEGNVYASGYHFLEGSELKDFMIQIPFENETAFSLTDLKEIELSSGGTKINYELKTELEEVPNPFMKHRYILKLFLTGKKTDIDELSFKISNTKHEFRLDYKFFYDQRNPFLKDFGSLNLSSFEITNLIGKQYIYDFEYKFSFEQKKESVYLSEVASSLTHGISYNSEIKVFNSDYELVNDDKGAILNPLLSPYYFIRLKTNNGFPSYFSNENIAFKAEFMTTSVPFITRHILPVSGEALAYKTILEKQEFLEKGLN